jgi:hypothetical protein
MPVYMDFLKRDSFTLKDSTGHPFSDPRFNGMCVPTRIQNLILEGKSDIHIPQHSRPVPVGSHSKEVVVPESTLSKWQLIAKSDLIVDPASIRTPISTSANPHPEQSMQWKGDFILSYQIRQLLTTKLVTKESSNPQVGLTTWYDSHSGFVLNWGLQTSSLALLPDCLFDDLLRIVWSSRMPEQTADPNITIVRIINGVLECNFPA